jgi:hypothetical protein
MPMNILIDMFVDAVALERLRSKHGLSVRLIEPEEHARPVAAEIVGDVEILFGEFPPENLADMPVLKLIQIPTAGHNQLHHLDLPAKGVRVCNARGNFDVPIAEWNIAMMVNLARNLRQMIRNQDTGTWDRAACFQREIRGSIVGLWGYGGLGRETARAAKAMGLRVHVLTRKPVGPSGNIYRVPGTGDPDGVLPDREFSPRPRTRVFLGPRFPDTCDATDENYKGNRWRARAAILAAKRFCPESRARTVNSGAGSAQGARVRLDCRRGHRHALLLPYAGESSPMAISQCHHDAPYLGIQ